MTAPASDRDLERVYLSDARGDERLVVNMVTTIDGATAIDGRSSSIGDRQDTVVFRALRAAADVVLVAGATARAEQYGTPRLPDHLVDWRRSRGLAELPDVAILTASLDVQLGRFDSEQPIVVTTEDADTDRLTTLDPDRLIRSGSGRVDLPRVLEQLHDRGYRSVLCEGGPSLNAQLAGADLVDEWCLTVSPLVVGGDSSRIVSGPPITGGRRYRLDRVMRGEQSVFLRWLRDREEVS